MTIINTSIITFKLVAIMTVELLSASVIPLVGVTVVRLVVLVARKGSIMLTHWWCRSDEASVFVEIESDVINVVVIVVCWYTCKHLILNNSW